MTRCACALALLLAACGARSGLAFDREPDAGVPESGTPSSPSPSSPPMDAGNEAPAPAFRGEICNGRDDDRNGIIDDGFVWRAAPDPTAVLVSNLESEPSGFASNGERYLAFYEGSTGSALDVFATPLDEAGNRLRDEQPLTGLVSSAHGGTVHGRAIAWAGDRYGVAWIDDRSNPYGQIFFNVLNLDGDRLVADDVSVRADWGFNPSLDWNGKRFVAVWSGPLSGPFQAANGSTIFARPIEPDAALGAQLTNCAAGLPTVQYNPFVAAAADRTAAAWIGGDTNGVYFALLDHDLKLVSGPLQLNADGAPGDFVRLAKVQTGWVAVWHGTAEGQRTIWGVQLDADGALIAPVRRIIDTPGHARYPFPISTGDRIIMVYSDDRDEGHGYDVFGVTLDASLAPLAGPDRLTDAPGDSIFPTASFGPHGDIGVIFRDDRTGVGQVYFTRLLCTK